MRFEGLKYHKMRLAVLILDDEERTAIFVQVKGPRGPHDAVARVTLPQPAETMPEPRAHLPLQARARRGPDPLPVSPPPVRRRRRVLDEGELS